jgi:hypothetical protein
MHLNILQTHKQIILGEWHSIANYEYTDIYGEVIRAIENSYKHIYKNPEYFIQNYVWDREIKFIPVDNYVIKLNPTYFKTLPWVNTVNVLCEICDFTDWVDNDKLYNKGEYDVNNVLSGTKYIEKENKFNHINITLGGSSVNGEILMETINSMLYHEINHAYEDFQRQSHGKQSLLQQDEKEGYFDLLKDYKATPNTDVIPKDILFVIYNLLTQTEFNARVVEVYAELKYKNAAQYSELYNTKTYKNIYLHIKNDILPEIEQIPLNNIQTLLKCYERFLKKFPNYQPLKPNKLKRKFIGHIAGQLSRLEDKMKYAADVWFMERKKHELNEDFQFYYYKQYRYEKNENTIHPKKIMYV